MERFKVILESVYADGRFLEQKEFIADTKEEAIDQMYDYIIEKYKAWFSLTWSEYIIDEFDSEKYLNTFSKRV